MEMPLLVLVPQRMLVWLAQVVVLVTSRCCLPPVVVHLTVAGI